MKLVKVHIRRGSADQSMMVYPSRYKAQEVDRCGLGMMNYSGHIGRGNKEEWLICCLDDEVADEYAKDEHMELIIQADALMLEWQGVDDQPEETVQDPNRIQAIIAKKMLNLPITAEDMRAMDPEDEIPGVNKRKVDTKRMIEKKGQKLSE